ncbi:MAG: hypothetical protein BHV81_01035 [Butyricimonas synergistica]|nr:MAG: hypothetical protein BHV81_01035 [Butyricimonas synergistica]
MYWAVFCIFLLLMFREINTKKICKFSFWFTYIILVCLIVLRKGQGTDYYNYELIYDSIKSIDDVRLLLLKKDFGFACLNYWAIQLNISYEFFVAIFAFVTMLLFFPFFYIICNKSMIPLFFFYTTFYLVYPFSGIRQGFTLAVLLGILYPLLTKKKYTYYIFVTLLCSLVHMSILICLVLPFIYHMRISWKIIYFVFAFFTVVLYLDLNFLHFFSITIDRIHTGESSSMKYIAKTVRVLVILPIFLVPKSIYNDRDLLGIRNILLMGFVVYSLFSFNELTSSRLGVYFRVFEGLFIMMLIYRTCLKKLNYQILFAMSIFASVFFVKDINSFLIQAGYKNCNLLSYPYLSVFHDESTIFYYRTVISD